MADLKSKFTLQLEALANLEHEMTCEAEALK